MEREKRERDCVLEGREREKREKREREKGEEERERRREKRERERERERESDIKYIGSNIANLLCLKTGVQGTVLCI